MDVAAGEGNITNSQWFTQDYSGAVQNLTIAFLVLATVAYILRFVARRIKRLPFIFNDWIMIPAFLVQIALDVTIILSAEYGAGRHYARIVFEPEWHYTYWGIFDIYVIAYLYTLAVTLPKLSILSLYLRVFVDRFSRWSCWFIISILLVNVVVEYITTGLQCNHLEYAWELWNQPGNCDDIEAHYRWASIPNLVTDVAMLLLPIPAIWKLQVERSAKVGLWITLVMGGLGLITGILRLVGFITYAVAYDGTWYSGILDTWTVVETTMYFVSACLLTYRPLLQWAMCKLGIEEMITRLTAQSTSSNRRSDYTPQRSTIRSSDAIRPRALEDGYGRESMADETRRVMSAKQPSPPARAHMYWTQTRYVSYSASDVEKDEETKSIPF